MIAVDSTVTMLGAALSAFEDAAMLCFQRSEWNGETGVLYLMESGWFWGRFLDRYGVSLGLVANSGSSLFISPCGRWPGCVARSSVSWPRWVDAAIVRCAALDAAWL